MINLNPNFRAIISDNYKTYEMIHIELHFTFFNVNHTMEFLRQENYFIIPLQRQRLRSITAKQDK